MWFDGCHWLSVTWYLRVIVVDLKHWVGVLDLIWLCWLLPGCVPVVSQSFDVC